MFGELPITQPAVARVAPENISATGIGGDQLCRGRRGRDRWTIKSFCFNRMFSAAMARAHPGLRILGTAVSRCLRRMNRSFMAGKRWADSHREQACPIACLQARNQNSPPTSTDSSIRDPSFRALHRFVFASRAPAHGNRHRDDFLQEPPRARRRTCSTSRTQGPQAPSSR